MPWFNTANLDGATLAKLTPDQKSWIYNGLDCCVTHEVFGILEAQLQDEPQNIKYTYAMALAKQAPYIEMELRGILVNESARQTTIKKMEGILAELDRKFQRLVSEVFDHQLNWKSPLQLKTFFYGELGIKEIKSRNANGIYTATVDEDALLQLQLHFYAKPYAKYVLAMRDLAKKIGFLKTEVDRDHRIRCNIQVVGTNTGRISSSASDFGTGTNLQNVDKTLRSPFIADPKKVLVECDLEQADARNVGAIIWDRYLDTHGAEAAGKYLDVCESADLHTYVTRIVWPDDLPWGDDPLQWKKIAKTDNAELNGGTYRDGSKRLGHGTNYYGQPLNMSRQTGIKKDLVEIFQYRYFKEFPLIKKWQEDTIFDIQTTGELTTPFGRRRHFFGRGNDKSTWRKAIAYVPQSMTGHEIDMGILNVWRHYPIVELLMQVHDSILFQVPWHNHQTHIEKAMKLLRFDWTLKGGREFSVPLEAKVGWNWGPEDETNKKGLRVWKGSDDRTPPEVRRFADLMK